MDCIKFVPLPFPTTMAGINLYYIKLCTCFLVTHLFPAQLKTADKNLVFVLVCFYIYQVSISYFVNFKM